MKGILVRRFGGPGVLEYVNLPEPIPGATELLIKVAGASVNYADLKARSGSYHLGKKPPFVPGIDLAGTVLETGSRVTRFKPGDRVVAFSSSGAYAERAVADDQLSFHVPENISLDSAAAFPLVAGAAMHMFASVAGLTRGDRVLIHAASGGVGSAAIQIAKWLGASMVAATTSSPWKRRYLQAIGADVIFDIQGARYQSKSDQTVSKERFDIILNPIGGSLVIQDFEELNDFGKLILYGSMNGPIPEVSANSLYSKNKQLIGFSFGHYRKFKPDTLAPTMEKVIEAVAGAEITIPIQKYYVLKDAPKAHEDLESKGITGKVVLIV